MGELLTFHCETEDEVGLGADVLHELLHSDVSDDLGLFLLDFFLHLNVLPAEVGELLGELRDIEDFVRLALLGGLSGVNPLLGIRWSSVF